MKLEIEIDSCLPRHPWAVFFRLTFRGRLHCWQIGWTRKPEYVDRRVPIKLHPLMGGIGSLVWRR